MKKLRITAVLLLAAALVLASCGAAKPAEEETAKKTENEGGTSAEDAGNESGESGKEEETEMAAEPDKIITVSMENAQAMNGGVFEGWGTSLCWWANRIGYSEPLSEKAAELFFSPEGLGLNIMRYNIGGGDDPTHDHIRRTDSAVPGWAVYDKESSTFSYDYGADARQLNVLQKAVKAAGDEAIVEVFSNSPPYFMTESGCSSGAERAGNNNLKSECVGEFADYLAEVTRYINDELEIPVQSLSPMNEPDTNYWHAGSEKQEGCHFDQGDWQSRMIVEIARALKEKGLTDVIVAASDETSTAKTMMAWTKYTEEAKAALGRVDTHTYDASGAVSLGLMAKDEGFHLWMSEVDGDGMAGSDAEEMAAGLWFVQKIISDLDALDPSAWVMWQAIDSHISKEGMNGNRDTGMVNTKKGFWGLAVADHDREEIILTQKYYCMGQLTRFILPGSTIIHTGKDTVAAWNPKEGTLTIAAVNAVKEETAVRFDFSELPALQDSARVIRTSGSMKEGEHWTEIDPVPVEKDGFTAVLAPNSVTTFVIEAVK